MAIACSLLAALVLPLQETAASAVRKIAGGFGFVEGPAWDRRNGRLLFSDIRGDRVLELDAEEVVATWLEPSRRANGLVFDRDGNLYACQGGARRVVRIAADGGVTVLAERFNGKRLNSPNDLALDDQGGLYFTDPRYGRADDLEQDAMAVYYVAREGTITRVLDELPRPNGIVVARDGSGLYVANPNAREIRFYPILSPGVLGRGRALFQGDRDIDGAGPDGMAIDAAGNVYTTFSGIVVLRPDGTLVERIAIPERPANCTFGGADGRTLFVTARTSLYAVRRVHAGQAARPPLGHRPPAPPELPLPRFERRVLDGRVGIGYGVAVTDVDGDRRPDVVLVDRDVVAWYRNPGWSRHVIARKLTRRDHVCVAARDIDRDGRAEIAVGGEWNPADTVASGSVHSLQTPGDPTDPWRPVELPHEPTVHRMRWVRDGDGRADLIVVPLHGRGNRAARGAGVRILQYRRPEPGEATWALTLVDDTLHQTHNLDPVQWDPDPAEEVLVAAREGLFLLDRNGEGWTRTPIAGPAEGDDFRGASEVRIGQLGNGMPFVVAVEPFHGNQVVLYRPAETGSPRRLMRRLVLDDTLAQAHAVACGDLMGLGRDQIVVGWRRKNAAGAVGLKLFVPLTADFTRWQTAVLDAQTACEDLRLADLDGDGRLDVVAAGRASHDLVVLFNRSPK